MVDWSQVSDAELLSALGSKPKSTTVGQDIRALGSSIYRGAKALPGEIYETGKAILENPGQAAAGIIPGFTSIADLPALLANATSAPGRYAVQKFSGNNEAGTESVPYYGHPSWKLRVANAIAGGAVH